jgi:hypothetical protein
MTNQASRVSGNVSVPRELLNRLFAFADVHWYGFDGDAELRAILAKPAAPIEQPCDVVAGEPDEIIDELKMMADMCSDNDNPEDQLMYMRWLARIRRGDEGMSRLQAELSVEQSRLSIEVHTSNKLGGERDALQSDLTKARELLAESLERLSSVRFLGLRERIRGVLANQSAPAAKCTLVECDACPTSGGCLGTCMKVPAAKGDL